MSYPAEAYFDIETLVNEAQPNTILLLGDDDEKTHKMLLNYVSQKRLLKQDCKITHIKTAEIENLNKIPGRFELGIALDLFEHLEKPQGEMILCKLRDLLTQQYCVCLPLADTPDVQRWVLSELFSFALNRVANYAQHGQQYGLFKYQLNDYKSTPDWLNSDNWSNPQMWGKYRW